MRSTIRAGSDACSGVRVIHEVVAGSDRVAAPAKGEHRRQRYVLPHDVVEVGDVVLDRGSDFVHGGLDILVDGTGGSDNNDLVVVAAFQGARGLDADGVAGPETLMALAGDAPGPHLLRVLE